MAVHAPAIRSTLTACDYVRVRFSVRLRAQATRVNGREANS